MSRVEDVAPEAVHIGMRVKFRIHRPGGDEPTYPVFTPVEGASILPSPAGGGGRGGGWRRSPGDGRVHTRLGRDRRRR